MNKEEMQQRVTDIIFNSGNTVSKPMIIDVVKFCKEYATQQCAAKDAEIDRLKGLIEASHFTGWRDGRNSFKLSYSWQEFKTENNL